MFVIKCTIAIALISLLSIYGVEMKCPPKNDSQSLDLEQFQGNWYMVAGVSLRRGRKTKCSRVVVVPNSENSFLMKFSSIDVTNNSTIKFAIESKTDDNITGFLKGLSGNIGPIKHRLIAADYDLYAAIVGCFNRYNNKNHEEPTFSMILSRYKTLPLPILNHLKFKLNQYIGKNDKINDIDQSC
ncbi:uncharacterized protein LOC103568263 [Microplitis demolitor]|uniref:uncharacterized protein LOC103568263 n=1 Tax=Microplitis demolitor TaxID=69319 RepID=UPI0004CDB23A|nr:uncharacterized protein LOC103568263 [Microplitis demolitor]